MAGPWDSYTKLLVDSAPQDFVKWLLGEAEYIETVSPHLKSRHVDADVLQKISIEGKPCLLHIEFQKRADKQMAKRLWEYNVLATCRFDLDVYSFVIYLQNDQRRIAQSPYTRRGHGGEEIHSFHFGTIKLWETSTEALLSTQLPGLLPLLPLTQEGKHRDVVEEAISGLAREKKAARKELLALAYGFASLALVDETDQDWLRWRFMMLEDILADSWAFKELSQKAREKGLAEGLEQGLERGMKRGLAKGMKEEMEQGLERQRQTLLAFVKARFPALSTLAEEKSLQLKKPEALSDLTLKVCLAQSEEEARQHLLAV